MKYLTPSSVKMDVEVENWQDAVRVAGEILVRIGAAEERYIEAMVKTAFEFGPYIVMTPGIAIPHARPEEGAKKVGLSAVKLKSPINFGNVDNDPVHLVLGFCSPNSEAHIDMLGNIALALEKENILQKIIAADRKEDIIQIFN
jgi:mannitol/fructose-specific phosphotransferase system IIA component (Ntr-type)